MRRTLPCVLCLIVAAHSATAQTTFAPITIPLTIEKLEGAPVWVAIGSPRIPGKDNEGNTSNGGFVVTDAGVVVFDALGTPSHGDALIREIAKVTDKPIRYVVVSHYHADHIYGLQAFREKTGALIVAHEKAAEYAVNPETSEENAGARLEQRRDALYPFVNETTRIIHPDITFRDRVTLVLGGKSFLIQQAGPAHSGSDAVMLVEPERVVFAGDVVQNERVPFMNGDDVDTRRWLAALDTIEAMNPSAVVPGHGRPLRGIRQALHFTRTYIQDVRTAMEQAVADWTPFDKAYAAADWAKYRDMPAFDYNNRGNAYRVYLELEKSGGK